MKKISHIDLFSGIGGFAYAIDQVFYEKKIEHIFVENNPFCQAVLRKHWPNSEIHGDIQGFTTDTRSEEQRGVSDIERKKVSTLGEIFILTGGFPCQPFSQSGIRKGTTDNRYLWPEMLRVISERKPRWIIGENVNGLLSIQNGMVFEQIHVDMEKEGYEVQSFIIPACAVGAPHQRQRIWIIGHAKRTGQQSRDVGQGKVQHGGTGSGLSKFNVANSESRQSWEQTKQKGGQNTIGRNQNAQNSFGERGDRWIKNRQQALECQVSEIQNTRPNSEVWGRSWQEVAFTTSHDGMDDGISRQMDGITISNAKHRQERLKACGNAIVPQVAMKILEAIKYIESCHPVLL